MSQGDSSPPSSFDRFAAGPRGGRDTRSNEPNWFERVLVKFLCTLVAVIAIWVCGVKPPFSSAFYALAIATDVLRMTTSSAKNVPWLLLDVNIPRRLLRVLAAVLLTAGISGYIFVDQFESQPLCLPGLYDYFSSYFYLANSQVDDLGGPCELPIGTVAYLLFVMQPILIVFLTCWLSLCFHLDGARNVAISKWSLFLNHRETNALSIPMMLVAISVGFVLNAFPVTKVSYDTFLGSSIHPVGIAVAILGVGLVLWPIHTILYVVSWKEQGVD